MQLTQKERMLLQDALSHEKVCIQKYQHYAQQTQDQQLKQLLNQYAAQEQQHYDTINQMLQGQEPNMSAGAGQQSQAQGMPGINMQLQPRGVSMPNQHDAMMLSDLLMTEKYVSSTYNTAIFESINPTIRQNLQHIQQEEQQHGEGLFNYMQQHGMYNVQG